MFTEHFLLSIVIHPENCSEQEKYYYLIATGCGRDERRKKPFAVIRRSLLDIITSHLSRDVRTKENNCSKQSKNSPHLTKLSCVACKYVAMGDVRVIKPGYTAVNKPFFIPAPTPVLVSSSLRSQDTRRVVMIREMGPGSDVSDFLWKLVASEDNSL